MNDNAPLLIMISYSVCSILSFRFIRPKDRKKTSIEKARRRKIDAMLIITVLHIAILLYAVFKV